MVEEETPKGERSDLVKEEAETDTESEHEAAETNKVIISIDLGTTFSCVYYYKDMAAHIVKNSEGERTTPSYVAFTENEVLVGTPAKDQAEENPKNTIFNVKRLIGLTYDDKYVQRTLNKLPYTVIRKNNRPCIEVLYKDKLEYFYPEEISAILLRKLKKDAEMVLGVDVTDVVITVPEHFNTNQRNATKLSGELAGLNVLYILNEPTAAALAYGVALNNTIFQNVLVFDLGGGTFDVTLIAMGARVIEVKKTMGNRNLGGEDFVDNLVDFCLKSISVENKDSLETDRISIQRLRNECEKVKRFLSTGNTRTINLNSLFEGKNFKKTITRKQFVGLNKSLFDETIKTVENTLIEAGMEKNEINEIIMVGGSSKIPYIRDGLKNFFKGQTIRNIIDQDEAVAMGGALRAAISLEDNWTFEDVTSYTVGVETSRTNMFPIIARNTLLPIKYTRNVCTSVDNQTTARIKIFEGEHPLTAHNQQLNEFKVFGLTPKPRGQVNIAITFEIKSDGLLNAIAEEIKEDGVSGAQGGKSLQITQIGFVTDEEFAKMKARLDKFYPQTEQDSIDN